VKKQILQMICDRWYKTRTETPMRLISGRYVFWLLAKWMVLVRFFIFIYGSTRNLPVLMSRFIYLNPKFYSEKHQIPDMVASKLGRDW